MVDKTMMGDKCAELVRAAMIGALAVTLGNPTAVYAAEEETADPGQIGIEIAGEAAVGAASFCVEEKNGVKSFVRFLEHGICMNFRKRSNVDIFLVNTNMRILGIPC